ncbi:MAG: ribose 5-phosphate isomerase B, partial [Verrucomicrobia bacterium 21-51-4]
MTTPLTISVGADHAGVDVRQALIEHLKGEGYNVIDHGTLTHDSVDYPDFAQAVGKDVADHKADLGMLVCSTGIGMSISANKVPGVRAALAHNEDSAEFGRKHNNANVLCMGAKYVDGSYAGKLADVFLATQF